MLDTDSQKVHFTTARQQGSLELPDYAHQPLNIRIHQVDLDGNNHRFMDIPIDKLMTQPGSDFPYPPSTVMRCRSALGLFEYDHQKHVYFSCGVNALPAPYHYGNQCGGRGALFAVALDDRGNLSRTDAVRVFTPSMLTADPQTGFDTGIWNSGSAPAWLDTGHLLVATGNGPFLPEEENFGCKDFEGLESFNRGDDCRLPCALNQAVKRVTTNRIGILHSDDWFEPQAIEACLRHDADIVCTQSHVRSACGSEIIETSRTTDAGFRDCEDYQSQADYLNHLYVFKRTKLLEVGGVDDRIGLTGVDDYDLLWTLLENGASMSIVEDPLDNYRDHDNSWRLSLQDPVTQLNNLERILDKHKYAEADRRQVRQQHGRWYGKTISQVRKQQQ